MKGFIKDFINAWGFAALVFLAIVMIAIIASEF